MVVEIFKILIDYFEFNEVYQYSIVKKSKYLNELCGIIIKCQKFSNHQNLINFW